MGGGYLVNTCWVSDGAGFEELDPIVWQMRGRGEGVVA